MTTIETVKTLIDGKWVISENPKTHWYRIVCSECGEDVTSTAPCIGFLPNAKVLWHYCPYCGAKKDEDRDYERAVEQLEHNMTFEPTYNPEDGSM